MQVGARSRRRGTASALAGPRAKELSNGPPCGFDKDQMSNVEIRTPMAPSQLGLIRRVLLCNCRICRWTTTSAQTGLPLQAAVAHTTRRGNALQNLCVWYDL